VDELGSTLNIGVAFATFLPEEGSYRRRKRLFSRSSSFGIDLDCGDGKSFATPDAALDHVAYVMRSHGIAPGAVVSSGSGIQPYYCLEEPISDGDAFEAMLKRLVKVLNGDEAAQDRTRILRPPSSYSFKYRPKRKVTLIEASGMRYPWEFFDKMLPMLPTVESPTAHGTDDWIRSSWSGRILAAPSKVVAALLDGALPPRYKGDTSRRDFLVACALVEAGGSAEDVYATMSASRLGVQAERKPNPEAYLRLTVSNAMTKTAARPSPGRSRGTPARSTKPKRTRVGSRQ
jgi:hypothetical protein